MKLLNLFLFLSLAVTAHMATGQIDDADYPDDLAQRFLRPRGRGGRRGRRGRRGKDHRLSKLYNYTDITTCTGDLLTTCDTKQGAGTGLFVCRSYPSRRDPEVTIDRPRCILSNMSFAETDTCGCCGEDCPEQCPAETCTCTYTRFGREKQGIELNVEGEDEPVCVSRKAATRMLARDDTDEISCNTDCA